MAILVNMQVLYIIWNCFSMWIQWWCLLHDQSHHIWQYWQIYKCYISSGTVFRCEFMLKLQACTNVPASTLPFMHTLLLIIVHHSCAFLLIHFSIYLSCYILHLCSHSCGLMPPHTYLYILPWCLHHLRHCHILCDNWGEPPLLFVVLYFLLISYLQSWMGHCTTISHCTTLQCT